MVRVMGTLAQSSTSSLASICTSFPCSLYSYILNTEAAGTFKMLVHIKPRGVIFQKILCSYHYWYIKSHILTKGCVSDSHSCLVIHQDSILNETMCSTLLLNILHVHLMLQNLAVDMLPLNKARRRNRWVTKICEQPCATGCFRVAV